MKNLEHLFKMFDHLVEELEDAQIDPVVIELINDARNALEDSLDDDDDDSYSDD
tara:strand:- start:140 stop:301 length:162 start_codon:yes stop_codon:yes gene_type:complete